MGARRSWLRETLSSSLDARFMAGASGAAFCIAALAEAPETRRGDRLPREGVEEPEFSMTSGVGKFAKEIFRLEKN